MNAKCVEKKLMERSRGQNTVQNRCFFVVVVVMLVYVLSGKRFFVSALWFGLFWTCGEMMINDCLCAGELP